MDEQTAQAVAAGVQPRRGWRHPVNAWLAAHASPGDHIADLVSGFLGSWKFIVLQTAIVAIWVAGNVYLLFHFDPYPFIFLNLAFSTQAAYAAPLILLASNRAAARDRLTLEHAATQTDVEEQQNERILTGLTEVLSRVQRLEEHILELEQAILTRVEASPATGGSGASVDAPAGPASGPSIG
jgi:uncharacterized membrane protein